MAESNSDQNSNNENEVNIRRGLDVIQSMIDISADRLEGLRTQCATSAELTQQEIRTLETKLVKMFSELLLTKAKLPERLPSRGLPATGNELRQWLRVVGLSSTSLNVVIQKVNSLELLLDKSEEELRDILVNNITARDEELRRLVRAMSNLRRCRDLLRSGELKEPMDLFWDSWDRHSSHHRASPRICRAPPRIGSKSIQTSHRVNGIVRSPIEANPPASASQDIISERLLHPHSIMSPEETSTCTLTPSPSPPASPSNVAQLKQAKKNFPTTPPPKRKHQTQIKHVAKQQPPMHHQQAPQNNNLTTAVSVNSNANNANSDQFVSLIKSKSHESQFLSSQPLLLSECISVSQQNKMNSNNNTSSLQSQPNVDNGSVSVTGMRSRLYTEPTPDQQSCIEPTDNNIPSSQNVSIPPKSPCTPIITRGMGHIIQHRFTKKFKVTKSTCGLCNKQMFFGFKCTECKYRCHKDCKSKVPPSCGLPPEFVDIFKATLQSDTLMPNASPNLGNRSMYARERARVPVHGIHGGPDSSSAGSSCNSSSPSSPALLSLPPQTPAASKHSQFHFPEVPNGNKACHDGITIETHPISIHSKTVNPNVDMGGHVSRIPKLHLSKLPESHQSNDSDKTGSTSAASTDSSSERTPIRLDSTEEREHDNWPRQNSLSLKEWDIPYDDLKLLEKIGNGRFGTVHRALWHGDVAVKLLKEDYVADERTLEAFKLEVATFKKTRHENVVLFMGACMKPPRLAIVTSLCKGNTLYTHIHIRKDKFNLNRTTIVAQQISQGMGYLHARGIVHKDLRTKNIFLENGKVIITDFGLFSATKLFYCDLGLGIPSGWLCYLAPELMCKLTSYRPLVEDLPFSKASDIYSFGTVWYELLCGEFPFKAQPPESVIWQVGRGMKQTLANLQASRDVKDILMVCWTYQADDRPDFAKLLTLLERLPKKRLARSPSHPVQLSRSAESVF
ncbi:kinase suppressor of Ras 2 [Toxorhynchites rutilus septentrionalis]|uniref:kinase suppressor of Ras 2 n=1 Tax=Toxorhynchites rutilus septentrionalis TaxID=329112 RepID=UPI002479A057|nr:kinase suppressor of Ras 2 [Toxorhynchites rutilus septentrionalis]